MWSTFFPEIVFNTTRFIQWVSVVKKNQTMLWLTSKRLSQKYTFNHFKVTHFWFPWCQSTYFLADVHWFELVINVRMKIQNNFNNQLNVKVSLMSQENQSPTSLSLPANKTTSSSIRSAHINSNFIFTRNKGLWSPHVLASHGALPEHPWNDQSWNNFLAQFATIRSSLIFAIELHLK